MRPAEPLASLCASSNPPSAHSAVSQLQEQAELYIANSALRSLKPGFAIVVLSTVRVYLQPFETYMYPTYSRGMQSSVSMIRRLWVNQSTSFGSDEQNSPYDLLGNKKTP